MHRFLTARNQILDFKIKLNPNTTNAMNTIEYQQLYKPLLSDKCVIGALKVIHFG